MPDFTDNRQIFVYSRGYKKGFAWTQVLPNGDQRKTRSPEIVSKLEEFIDVGSPSLVLPAPENNTVSLLFWGIPSNRPANAGRQVVTGLLFTWNCAGADAEQAALKNARALIAEWLKPDNKFSQLVNDYIRDPTDDELDQGFSFRIKDNFLTIVDEIIRAQLPLLQDNEPVQNGSIPAVQDTPQNRIRLAEEIRRYRLPPVMDVGTPLIVITELKYPVAGVWRMLTALPSQPAEPVGTPGRWAKASQQRPFGRWSGQAERMAGTRRSIPVTNKLSPRTNRERGCVLFGLLALASWLLTTWLASAGLMLMVWNRIFQRRAS